MNVRNMCSSRSGREVANQFDITADDGTRYFQSYRTVIVKISPNGKVTLDPKWECSPTTIKYRGWFLGENTKETRRKIASGVYAIAPLNK